MTSHEFSIPAHDLDSAGRRFELVVRSAWLRGALEGTDVSATDADGLLDVRVSKSGTDVVVHGTLTATLSVPCARCLEPAEVKIREDVSALVVPGPGPGSAAQAKGESDDDADEEAGTTEDPDVMTYDGETVVLDELVRDQLLLAVPMIPLCSESCPGIRPEPATEKPSASIDPRLAPLLKLRGNSKP